MSGGFEIIGIDLGGGGDPIVAGERRARLQAIGLPEDVRAKGKAVGEREEFDFGMGAISRCADANGIGPLVGENDLGMECLAELRGECGDIEAIRSPLEARQFEVELWVRDVPGAQFNKGSPGLGFSDPVAEFLPGGGGGGLGFGRGVGGFGELDGPAVERQVIGAGATDVFVPEPGGRDKGLGFIHGDRLRGSFMLEVVERKAGIAKAMVILVSPAVGLGDGF